MDLSLRLIKSNNKKTRKQASNTGQRIPRASSIPANRPEEPTIWEPGTGWMSTIKLKKDCICLGHLASNTQSSQENKARLAANQSVHTIVAIS